jgi:hypothetical protein
MNDSLCMRIGQSLCHLLAKRHLSSLVRDLSDKIGQSTSWAKLCDHVVLVVVDDVAIIELEDVGVV